MEVTDINPYMAAPAALLILIVIYVWWSLRIRVNTKSKRAVDLIFLWPRVLQGQRTSREKVAIWAGIMIAALLIGLSFTLPRP